MIFLPVVERELRVASRKRSTYRVRVAAAAVALVIGAGFLLLARATALGPAGPFSGSGLFATLTWLGLAGALSAGVFLTSDCLSEEKRAGTVGLLFLTDLRSHDLVMGKLLATSLRAGCALMGVFPILAITLLMGGVSVGQFWQTCLALAVALLLSLAAGMFVSTISRASSKALSATLLLLLGLCAAGPLFDTVYAAFRESAFNPATSYSSPVFLYLAAARPGSTSGFWPALAGNALTSVVLLGSAFVLLPCSWQEKHPAGTPARAGWTRWWRFGGQRVREVRRRRLLDRNPMLWLACRERWQSLFLWCVAVVQVAGCVAVSYHGGYAAVWMAWSYLAGLLTLLLYLGLASQAGRCFVESRKSGLIELALSTPLAAPEIVRGQWSALLRMSALPLAIAVTAQFFGGVGMQQMMWEELRASTPVAGVEPPALSLAFVAAGSTTLAVAANLVAVAWFGMWMGLTSRSENSATLKTLLYVQVLPWFVINFAVGLMIPLLLLPLMSGGAVPPARYMIWFPLLSTGIGALLNLGKDGGFVLWSRRKLYRDLRDRVVRGISAAGYPASS